MDASPPPPLVPIHKRQVLLFFPCFGYLKLHPKTSSLELHGSIFMLLLFYSSSGNTLPSRNKEVDAGQAGNIVAENIVLLHMDFLKMRQRMGGKFLVMAQTSYVCFTVISMGSFNVVFAFFKKSCLQVTLRTFRQKVKYKFPKK